MKKEEREENQWLREQVIDIANSTPTAKLKRKIAEIQSAMDKQGEDFKRKFAEVKRKFAEPKNSEEAEGLLPETTGKVKAKKQILAGDNLLDKLRLLFSHYDFMGYWDVEPILSDRDMLKIKDSIKTKADLELYGECMREYQTIKRFGNRLKYCFKCFQVSYSCLAVLLNRLDSYEELTKRVKRTFEMLQGWVKEEKKKEMGKINLDRVIENYKETGDFKLEGAEIVFNPETNTIELDDSKLYEEILKEAAVVANELADFKAHIEAADYYIENSHLKYTPISIEMSWENAILEKYTRYLVKNKRYFLSELFHKIDKGEQPTEEEQRYAVIADYQETKRDERVYIDCLEDLGYNIEK